MFLIHLQKNYNMLTTYSILLNWIVWIKSLMNCEALCSVVWVWVWHFKLKVQPLFTKLSEKKKKTFWIQKAVYIWWNIWNLCEWKCVALYLVSGCHRYNQSSSTAVYNYCCLVHIYAILDYTLCQTMPSSEPTQEACSLIQTSVQSSTEQQQ